MVLCIEVQSSREQFRVTALPGTVLRRISDVRIIYG